MKIFGELWQLLAGLGFRNREMVFLLDQLLIKTEPTLAWLTRNTFLINLYPCFKSIYLYEINVPNKSIPTILRFLSIKHSIYITVL